MHIHPISVLKDNYVWTIINDKKDKAIIVDPGSATEVLQFLTENHLDLIAILITHHHADHTLGILEIKNVYNKIPVYGSKVRDIAGVDHKISEGSVIAFKDFDLTLKVFDIPGHTLSHVAYYDGGMVFTGDTLFSAGCGRLFEGTPIQMMDSLQKIQSLPDETAVYCGHEYTLNNLKFASIVEPSNAEVQRRLEKVIALREKGEPTLPSSLKIEKTTNPFLRVREKEVIANVENFAGQKLNSPVDVFAYLRQWKDGF